MKRNSADRTTAVSPLEHEATSRSVDSAGPQQESNGAKLGFKILIINWRDVTHPRSGGAETYLHEVAKVWIENGHDVTWLTASYPKATKYAVIDGVKVIRVGSAVTVYFWAAVEYVQRLRGHFDVIVDAENGIPFFSPVFSKKPKILLMFHVHRDVFLRQLPWPISWMLVFFESKIMPFMYRHAALVTISEDTRNEMLAAGITRQQIPIAYPGIDAALAPGPKTLHPTICYVGRLEPYKRVDLLISAMPRILARVPTARLIVAGRGVESARLQQLVANLSLGSAVELRGFVSEEQKRQIYQSAWVCGVPSAKEGWCIAALEANACGTPVVAFDVDGIRGAVPHGRGAVLLEEGADMSVGILTLLEDDDLRERQALAGLLNAAQYRWDKTASQIMTVIESATRLPR